MAGEATAAGMKHPIPVHHQQVGEHVGSLGPQPPHQLDQGGRLAKGQVPSDVGLR